MADICVSQLFTKINVHETMKLNLEHLHCTRHFLNEQNHEFYIFTTLINFINLLCNRASLNIKLTLQLENTFYDLLHNGLKNCFVINEFDLKSTNGVNKLKVTDPLVGGM